MSLNSALGMQAGFVEPVSVPESFEVQAALAVGSIGLSWQAQGGVQFYRVWCGLAADALTLVADELTQTGYTISGLTPGQQYFVQVTGVLSPRGSIVSAPGWPGGGGLIVPSCSPLAADLCYQLIQSDAAPQLDGTASPGGGSQPYAFEYAIDWSDDTVCGWNVQVLPNYAILAHIEHSNVPLARNKQRRVVFTVENNVQSAFVVTSSPAAAGDPMPSGIYPVGTQIIVDFTSDCEGNLTAAVSIPPQASEMLLPMATLGPGLAGGGGTLLDVLAPLVGGASTIIGFDGTSGTTAITDPSTALCKSASDTWAGCSDLGGANKAGTMFVLVYDGLYYNVIKMYDFQMQSAANPGQPPNPAALIFASDGTYWGITQSGGAPEMGSVFRLTPASPPPYSYQEVLAFTNDANGSFPVPEGITQGSDGSFYVSTLGPLDAAGSGSVILKITPQAGAAFAFEPIHTFNQELDGLGPNGVAEGMDGTLYGTTRTSNTLSSGTFFKLNKDGTGFQTIKRLNPDGSEGQNPAGKLAFGSDGRLYGVCSGGPTAAEVGKIFAITTDGAYSVLHSFTTTDGAYPNAGLVKNADGKFYGTTTSGGSNGAGTIFSITEDGIFAVVHHFDPALEGQGAFGLTLK